ncbi:Map3k9_0 protein [Gryllus bimaculatus]|nr:Map3k9_0 protein [Gryllus bimaculatus]
MFNSYNILRCAENFRHTITVQHSKGSRNPSSPNSPPGSPSIPRLRAIAPHGSGPWVRVAVPADGVKGKTWGPSTVHQRERCQIPLAAVPGLAPQALVFHGPKRWSRSAPCLEKPLSARALSPPGPPQLLHEIVKLSFSVRTKSLGEGTSWCQLKAAE